MSVHGFAQDHQTNWVIKTGDTIPSSDTPWYAFSPLCPTFNLQQRCLAVPVDFMMLVPIVQLDFLLPCRCIVMVRCTSVVAEGRRRWMICPYISFRLLNGSWQRDVMCIWWYYMHAAVPRLERPALVSCEWSDITRFFLGSMHRLTHRLGKKGFMDSDG